MVTDYEAEHFIAQCRRDAARRPLRDIAEVAPVRIVSHALQDGCVDSFDWTEFSSSGLPFLLKKQAE